MLRGAARAALTALQQEKPASAELDRLRGELESLRKRNRDLAARLKQLESTVGGQVMVNNRFIKLLLTGHVNNHVDPAACFVVHGGADPYPGCYDNSQHHTSHLLFLTHFVLLIVQNNLITPATVLQVSFETPNFLISAKASFTFVTARLTK